MPTPPANLNHARHPPRAHVDGVKVSGAAGEVLDVPRRGGDELRLLPRTAAGPGDCAAGLLVPRLPCELPRASHLGAHPARIA
ncbi:MAG: hypothetical protein Q7R45_14250, partial [Sulfuricaulis sp.]|nr:hypothetical protein [Sulfuricaulis sp.]